MAAASYDAVAQADDDHESVSESDPSPSPPKDSTALQPLPLDASNLGPTTESAEKDDNESSLLHRLGSMVRSSGSPVAYDVLDEDDYDSSYSPPVDTALRPSVGDSPREESSCNANTPLDSPVSADPDDDSPPAEEEPAWRSVSSSTLSHPMPGLQSMRGAYVGNIERLERSAEHLSLTSSDLGSEIRKMDRLQKERSTSSASNSTRMRSGTFSPPLYASSPRRSSHMRSVSGASRLTTQIVGHEEEQEEGEEEEEEDNASAHGTSISPVLANFHNRRRGEDGTMSFCTYASGDTYQQARILFRDFDGVHFASHDISAVPSRTVSRRSFVSRAESSSRERGAEGDMIYYPAPVPMMLNLPPLLSQKSNYEKANRKREIFGPSHPEAGKAAAVVSLPPIQFTPIPEENEPNQQPSLSGQKKQRRRLTKAAPQLRANTYFDRTGPPRTPPPTLPEIKQASAVAMLDEMLDLSVHAPVSAFTDHPFAGPLGAKKIYGKEKDSKAPHKKTKKKKNNNASRSSMLLGRQAEEMPDNEGASTVRRSTVNGSLRTTRSEDEAGSSIYDDARTEGDAEGDEEGESEQENEQEDENDEEEDEIEEDYVGPPTTLLGELHARKLELQQRRRTAAASAGMHSTLLQLETVAQRQSEQRRHKRITLAWEDPELHEQNREEDDEDVPLGVLYPDSKIGADNNEDRPLGLLQRKEVEEGEALSRRRARLRGEHPRQGQVPGQVPPEPAADESEDEGETLAQRMKRLRAARAENGQDREGGEKRPSEVSNFTAEVLAEIDNTIGPGKEEETKKEEEEEEEEEKKPTTAPKEETLGQRRRRLQRQSNTLRRDGAEEQQRLGGAEPYSRMNHQTSSGDFVGYPSFDQSHSALCQSQYAMVNPYMRSAAYGTNPYGRHSTIGLGKPYGYNAKPSIDPGQREMIDRWRMSIVK